MLREGTKVELKKSLATEEEVLETACAFANTEGGTIYIGVADDGTATGISIGKSTLVNLANLLTRTISPPIYPKISESVIDEKPVIIIEINRSEHKPHFYKGRAFKRIGSMNKVVEPLGLERMFREKFLEKTHIDSETSNAGMGEVDEKTIKKFTKIIRKPFNGIEPTLQNLGVMKNKNLTNASILFFGKNPSKHFPLYGVKVAEVRGNEIIDMVEFGQNIFEVVEQAIEYIVKKIPRKLFFDKAVRYEKPIVPREVIREAIVNALIHRDYSTASSIFIKISESEIEIKNPGTLPEPLKISDLYRAHESKPRNPLLAELAHKAKMIEHWGSGTIKIIAGMRKSGLQDPTFLQEGGYFKAILPLKEISLNKRQERILDILKTIPSASFHYIAKTTNGRERTLRRDLDEMAKRALVFKIKKGRETTYSLTK